MARPYQDDFIVGGDPPVEASDARILTLGSEPGSGGDEAPGVDEPIVLELADLLPDEAGEVVLFAGDDVTVNLLTDSALTGSGIADKHVTAAGVDVSGQHYYNFEGGITVYSINDVLVTNTPEGI